MISLTPKQAKKKMSSEIIVVSYGLSPTQDLTPLITLYR